MKTYVASGWFSPERDAELTEIRDTVLKHDIVVDYLESTRTAPGNYDILCIESELDMSTVGVRVMLGFDADE